MEVCHHFGFSGRLAKDPAYCLDFRVLGSLYVFSYSKNIEDPAWKTCHRHPAATLSHSEGDRLAGRLGPRSADQPLPPLRQAHLWLPEERRPWARSLRCAAVLVGGTQTTRSIPAAQAETVRARTEEYQRLCRLQRELVEVSEQLCQVRLAGAAIGEAPEAVEKLWVRGSFSFSSSSARARRCPAAL